jgi:hypothetical protein
MKLKGVNPIERHIEKIVLGLMLVVLLGVVSIQFVTRPNDIEDAGRTIAPAQVYTALESQANQLQSQISDLSPALPEVKPVDLVQRYNSAFENAGVARLALSSPLGEGVNIANATGTQVSQFETRQSGPVGALDVPATSTPIVASQWATLDPYAVQIVPEYDQFIPAQQPYDFPSISVEASFSGTDLQAILNGENGANAIPRRFWSATGIAILRFEVQRQQRMPDGSWADAQPIQTPPRTPIPTQAINTSAGLQDLTTLVGNAARSADEVIRPMFPPTIAGSPWTPPSERVGSADDSESAQIKRLQRQLQRARDTLERLTNPARTTQDPRSNPGGGGKTGTRDDTRTQPNTTNDRNRDRIQAERDKIQELEDELRDLGVDSDDANAVRVRTSRNDVRSVLEEEAIDLWAHDLGVEPGATYRYRTRVVVNNPLFRKGGELDPDDQAQQDLARDPFAYGEWSGWSEPVVAGAKAYYFVTSTDLGSMASNADARTTIELYQMYYGHYRKSTLSVSPGDMLATNVRISGDLLAFDTATITAQDAAEVVESLGNDGESDELPEGITQLPGRLSIDLGVYVLDLYQGQDRVQTGLGGERLSITRVVLRDIEGNIIVQTEQDDEASLAYALASESASSASSTPLRAPGEPAISPAAELFAPVQP